MILKFALQKEPKLPWSQKTDNVGLLSLLPALKNCTNRFSNTEIPQVGFLAESR